MRKLDLIDGLAILLICLGVGLFTYGLSLDPPASFQELVQTQFGDWTPGFVTDGVLLIVINRVIHKNERRRVISQVASLSNEFALDAVRRCRDEGWLNDGSLRSRNFDNARLASADLSSAELRGASLRFSDLSGVDLTHADLADVDLTGTNLAGADLRWANLANARLSWSDLRGAQLEGANLLDAKTEFAAVDEEAREKQEFEHAVVGGFLTEQQTLLIQHTFQKFRDKGEDAARSFYDRVFTAAPAARSLFPDDVGKQARKFVQSLNVIVSSLTASDRATRTLQRLGERHRQYGVVPDHYEPVGQALIATLKDELGSEFTQDAEQAWSDAFRLISLAMISGAGHMQLKNAA